MARYGALTSYGQLTYGAGPTNAAKIYRGLQEGVRDAFDTDEGTHVEASNYARARCLAAARRYLFACYEQRDPKKATFGLEKLEHDYGLTPAPGDSDDLRRGAVGLARKVKRGSSREALETALGSFLGDGFVGLFYPEDPGVSQGRLGFERTDLPHRFWTLTTEVLAVGEPVTVGYAPIGRDDGYRVQAGDRLYVHSSALAQYDAIVVESSDALLGTFTATFEKPHPAGTSITTHAPFYLVGWRNVRVGLTSQVLAQNRLVRKVRDFLDKTLRAVTTYQLIPGSQTPFQITAVTPAFVVAGSGDAFLSVDGIDLPFTGILKADGIECSTFWVSDVALTATVPAYVTAIPGFKVLRVVDGVRLSNPWEWAVNFPIPTLGSLVPPFAFFDELEQAILASGTGFAPTGTSARFDAQTAAYIPNDATTATLIVPPAITMVAGTKSVRIVNPIPGGGTSNALDFEIRYRPPVLLALSLSSIFVGRPTGAITITGPELDAAFYAASEVLVDGVLVPSVTLSRTSITFVFPTAIAIVAGTKRITVRNPATGGGGGTSNELTFDFIAPVLIAIDISEVPQYFDGFDVSTILDNIDSSFVITYNDVAQPTTFVDAQRMIAHVTSAACAVPGTTMVRAKDTISGLSTNALVFEVHEWDPLRLGATLRMWLDGSSLVDDGTGKASSWEDKSGGARHCLPVTAGQLPVIVPSSAYLNGKRAARFSGSPVCNLSYTPWLASAAVGLIREDQYTIWVVASTLGLGFSQTTIGDFYGYIYVAATSNGPPSQDLVGLDSSGGNTFVRTLITWYPAPTPFVIRQRKTPTHLAARVKRDAEVVVAHYGTNTAFDPSICYIGSASKTGGAWLGEIAEVVICDTDVNSTHKAMMDNRFSYIYGLPFGSGVGKPVITSLNPPVCSQYDLPFWLYVNNTAAGYTPTSVINIFDTPLVTEFISATQIRARIPAWALGVPKGLAITVADAGGISAPTGLAVLPFVNAPGLPNLHTVEPSTAIQHTDPLPIRVRGAGFTASSVVKANGVSLTSTLDGADLLATVPATELDVLPGPIITVSDPSGDSPNALEITLSPWSPLNIPFLSVLCAADDVLVVDGKVTQWNDKTGKGNHYTQTDPTKQAAYVASDPAFAGKPSVQFDGVNDLYTCPNSFFVPIGTGDSVFAAVYRYLVVDGAGSAAQPYVNDVMMTAGGIGVAAHLVPLTLIAYANDGTYRSVANTGLVVGQTQRCQYRITSRVMSLEIGEAASPTYTLASVAGGNALNLGYMNFGTNNAMNGKLAVWCCTKAAWSAQDSICWKNWCRYHYGTTA